MVKCVPGNDEIRHYPVAECIAFRKTTEPYGGLSNMAPKYPIVICGVKVLTSEALYQACRFPEMPEIQKMIIEQHSPMTAKDISRKYNHLTRPDWEKRRVQIMQWALNGKLLYNWKTFGELLDSTGEKYIVEDSPKDTFWGAAKDGSTYSGVNALGRLLMQLRQQYRHLNGQKNIVLKSPPIENFSFLGTPIPSISVDVTNVPYGSNIRMW